MSHVPVEWVGGWVKKNIQRFPEVISRTCSARSWTASGSHENLGTSGKSDLAA